MKAGGDFENMVAINKAELETLKRELAEAKRGIANSAIWQEEVRMAIVDRLAPDDRPHPLPPTFAACIHRIADMREEARDQRDRAHRDSAYAERLRKFIEALPCPNPLCQDGSIISTGPDPQNDPCEWCMDRHYTLQPDSQVAPVEPLTGQRCYLAGPMRGYPQFNFPAFFAAAKSLRERGYEVWSPAENDVHQDGFDPAKDAAQPMRHYMKRDLPAVLDADFVAVLPGWEHSQGATLEVTVARTCGIPVLDAATLAVAPRVEDRTPYLRDLLHRLVHGSLRVTEAALDEAREFLKNGTPEEDKTMSFTTELQDLINKHSRENASNTPDWILANFMHGCLMHFEGATKARDDYYGIAPEPGDPKAAIRVSVVPSGEEQR